MPTPAQEAFAEGFTDLDSVHGTSWTVGSTSFRGVASILKPDDPRLLGSSDRLLEITVPSASVPSAVKRGVELTRDGRNHRVTRDPLPDYATGLTSILVVA